jgi:hypothetical protein
MANLKTETLRMLNDNNKTWSDVRWIGHGDGSIKLHPDYFLEIADREYNSGYGGQEVNTALVVVGDDWWLERCEYDGSEWWEFNTIPILLPNAQFGKSVFINPEEYEDDWSIMSNLEYLEYIEHLNETKSR